MSKTVRVYLTSDIMDDKEHFEARRNNRNGNNSNDYFFYGLPIDFYDGNFSINTMDGEVPKVFMIYRADKYSLKEIWLDGFRHGGLYRDERFPTAELQVKQCRSSQHSVKSDTYNIEISGTELKDVLGLYYAIVADELQPIERGGKTATQLAEELEGLQLQLSVERERAEGFLHSLRAAKAEVKELQQAIDLWRTNVEKLQECFSDACYDLSTLRYQLQLKPWYRRLYWLVFGINEDLHTS